MRIEGRTRTGTSKIIFQVCREAKVNRERGAGCQVDEGRPWKWEEEEPKLSLCRRHWPLQFLSSGRRRTVCAKTATNSELTNVSVKPLGDSLTLCPIIRAPPQKKDDDDTKIALNFWRRHFQQKWRIFKAMALLDLAEYNMIQMNDDGTICWPEGCITPTHDFSRRRRLSRAPILLPHTAGLGFLQ